MVDTAAERSLLITHALVTGAGGFIGSHLVERLVAEGVEVRALVRYNSRNDRGLLDLLPVDVMSEVEVFWGDLRDPNVVRKAVCGIHGVFHLGALISIPYSYHTPDAYVATNVGGTLNLLQACLDESVDFFVHTSTSEVYGTAQRVPMDEAHPLHAQSPYAATKIAADQLAQSFYLSFGLPVATIRPFNAFGPRQSTRAVIPTIVDQAIGGGVIRMGALDPVRDFTYVEDVVSAFVLMAREKGGIGEVVNVGSGTGITIKEVVSLVLRLTGRNAAVEEEDLRLRPDSSEVMRLVCDNGKARSILGWAPTHTLEEGLLRVIECINTDTKRVKDLTYAI